MFHQIYYWQLPAGAIWGQETGFSVAECVRAFVADGGDPAKLWRVNGAGSYIFRTEEAARAHYAAHVAYIRRELARLKTEDGTDFRIATEASVRRGTHWIAEGFQSLVTGQECSHPLSSRASLMPYDPAPYIARDTPYQTFLKRQREEQAGHIQGGQ